VSLRVSRFFISFSVTLLLPITVRRLIIQDFLLQDICSILTASNPHPETLPLLWPYCSRMGSPTLLALITRSNACSIGPHLPSFTFFLYEYFSRIVPPPQIVYPSIPTPFRKWCLFFHPTQDPQRSLPTLVWSRFVFFAPFYRSYEVSGRLSPPPSTFPPFGFFFPF